MAENVTNNGETYRTLKDSADVNYVPSFRQWCTSSTAGASTFVTPVAATLANGLSLPVAAPEAVVIYLYNGSTIDMAPGSTADGQLVNLGGNNDVTLATLPDTASNDLAAMVVDLASIEVLLGTIDADTGNIATSVSSIDTKTPALGQALAAGSVPVVLTAAQITTLTPPAAITGFALESGGNLATIAAVDFATQTTLATLLTENTFTGRVGEVQTTPTTNTVLGRLKDLLTGIVLAAGSNVVGFVNLITGQTGITGGAGAVAANTPRITHASDDPAVSYLATIAGDTTSLDGKVTACDTGSVTIASALPSGGNLIGNVQVTDLIPGISSTNLGKAEDGVHVNGSTGVFILSVRRDTSPSSSAGTSGDYAAINTDENGRLWSRALLDAGTNLIGKVDHATTGIGHGVKTVTTAGAHEALAGSTAAKWVIVTAQTDNTNLVAVGGDGVDATIATGTGTPIYPGDSVSIPCDNLADVFVDAIVSGEGVRYTYGT
jgi:hypothetical protein